MEYRIKIHKNEADDGESWGISVTVEVPTGTYSDEEAHRQRTQAQYALIWRQAQSVTLCCFACCTYTSCTLHCLCGLHPAGLSGSVDLKRKINAVRI